MTKLRRFPSSTSTPVLSALPFTPPFTLPFMRSLTLLFVMLFVISACGSDSGSEAAPDGADRDEAAAAPASEQRGVPEQPAVPVISAGCPVANPTVEVEVDVVGWDAPPADRFVTALTDCDAGNYRINPLRFDRNEAFAVLALDAASGSPEIELYQGSTDFLTELARAGVLEPLDDLIDEHGERYGLDRIDPSVWASVSVGDERFAIPVAPADGDLVAGAVPVVDHGYAVAATTAADREALFLALVAAYEVASG